MDSVNIVRGNLSLLPSLSIPILTTSPFISQMSIVHNSDTFDIYLQNGEMLQFPNRLGDQTYKYIFFVGDATIQDISVRPSEKPTKR